MVSRQRLILPVFAPKNWARAIPDMVISQGWECRICLCRYSLTKSQKARDLCKDERLADCLDCRGAYFSRTCLTCSPPVGLCTQLSPSCSDRNLSGNTMREKRDRQAAPSLDRCRPSPSHMGRYCLACHLMQPFVFAIFITSAFEIFSFQVEREDRG
jgi:hypothetical protein